MLHSRTGAMLSHKLISHFRRVSPAVCLPAPIVGLLRPHQTGNLFTASIFDQSQQRRQIWRTNGGSGGMVINVRHYALLKKKRHRHRTSASKQDEEEDDEQDEDDEDDEADVEDGAPKDYRTKEFSLLSRRLDTVVGHTLNATASSIGNALLQGLVRVNETVIIKKAQEVEQGDVVEVWVAPYEDNDRLATVVRVRIVRCRFDRLKGYQIKAKCWQNFLTDNWTRKERPETEQDEHEENVKH